jgi:predicted anti-sigma-YlaC factor YlaD
MSDHILEQLGAYLDGELNNREHQKVEKHLEECAICQEEYASLESLSSILSEAPLPDFPSPKDFSANVALHLPRKSIAPTRSKVLEISWWMAPIGLLTAWIFIITTNLIGEILGAANSFGLVNISDLLGSSSSTQASWSATLSSFGLLGGSNLQWAQILESFIRTTVPQMIFQISIAILYLSWMAIWWARHTRQEFGYALEN